MNRSMSRRTYGRGLKSAARGRLGSTLAPPAKSFYGGFKGTTYNEYVVEFAAKVTLTGAFTTQDIIQAIYWQKFQIDQVAAVDPQVGDYADDHEYFRVKWTGIAVKPEFNIVGASNAIQIGEIALCPVMKDPVYRFASSAVNTGTFQPPDLKEVSTSIAGTVMPACEIIQPRWVKKFQPGVTLSDQTMVPDWDGQTSQIWTVPKVAEWSPLWQTDGAQGIETMSDQEIWTPMALFANWNATVSLPMNFSIKWMCCLQFKDRRFRSGEGGFRQSGPIVPKRPLAAKMFGLSPLGEPSLREQKVMANFAEEKEYPVPPSPKIARSESNSGLTRQFTNVGIGDPQGRRAAPHGTGLKRVNEVTPM